MPENQTLIDFLRDLNAQWDMPVYELGYTIQSWGRENGGDISAIIAMLEIEDNESNRNCLTQILNGD